MDPIVWDIFRSVIGFGAVLAVGIGAWWCKGMAMDIRELGKSEQTNKLALQALQSEVTHHKEMETLRWQTLNDKVDTMKGNIETILRRGYNPQSKVQNV